MTSAEGRHAEIARRYKSKQADKPPISIAALRIAELRRLFLDRYGRTLPDDDAGRDDVMVMAHHLARRHTDPERIHNWIELNAPWMAADESGEIVRQVVARPFKWRADKLAARLRLTEADRRRLRIRTIGAVDMTKQERQQARQLRQRQRDRARRRSRGAKPRTEYEANSVNRTKPWIALGMSRATWYRRRETSVSAI
jgi:hypothetical protein